MANMYCENCDKQIDLDFDVDHEYECKENQMTTAKLTYSYLKAFPRVLLYRLGWLK